MTASILDSRQCELGEGPLWHPERKQLFWFDILNRSLLSVRDGEHLAWSFDEYVSAAGWVDHNTLLIASETRLFHFDLETGARETLVQLEASNGLTRSNDGRADRQGGFWIGTMGKAAEPGAGAIYRFFRGELRLLYSDISIPNAMCFAQNGRNAYFTDSAKKLIMIQALDEDGWPHGDPRPAFDMGRLNFVPDGAIVDREDNLWIACWGSGQVVCVTPEGSMKRSETVPAAQPTCPAFIGERFDQLVVTTAYEHMVGPAPSDGLTYLLSLPVCGTVEPRVLL